MKKIPFYDLKVNGGLWAEKQELVKNVTAKVVYDRFYDTGRISTMDCEKHPEFENELHVFWGSDVFKWMEGAAYLYELNHDEKLRALVEQIIDSVEKGMCEDGYYNSYFCVKDEKRFSNRGQHELYSLGHMIEAAVAWSHATGDKRFMKLCRRNVDLVDRIFRIENSADFMTPGHQEIELALVRLYNATGEERYLKLAEFFVDKRGNNDKDSVADYGPLVDQSDIPARKLRNVTGHAVRAVYYYCAIADLAGIEKDDELLESAKALFDDIYNRKMYITGGIGAVINSETFSAAYHLPNREAYAETCAALGLALFASRMYSMIPDGRYGDAAERALYNGMLSGLSISGDRFFYENPLEINTSLAAVPNLHQVPLERVKVFFCSCCPPNLVRMIPSVAGLAYTVDNDTLFVHQYIPTSGKSGDITVNTETDYPLGGRVSVKADGVKRIALRKPAWCDSYSAAQPCNEENGYLYFESNTVNAEFDIRPKYIAASPAVKECADSVALMYGPIVYALEEQDQPVTIDKIRICPEVKPAVTKEFFGGLPILEGEGIALPQSDKLYSEYKAPCKYERIKLRFIPYYTFANRGEDNMRVWNPIAVGRDK